MFVWKVGRSMDLLSRLWQDKFLLLTHQNFLALPLG